MSNINKPTMNIESTGTYKVDLEDVHAPIYESTDPTDKSNIIKQNKYYVPALYINDTTLWPSQPMENRKLFTDEEAHKACLGNCCGIKGLKAACCHVDLTDLEHVLGPVDELWIKYTLRWLNKNGIYYKRSDLVIDFEEGTYISDAFFNGHQVFKSKQSYPMLRLQVVGPRLSCKFLNEETGRCTIYHHRPPMCSEYFCQFIKTNYLIRTKDKPNTYIKIR